MSASAHFATSNVIGTECTMTNYAELTDYLKRAAVERQQPLSIDFTNTQIAAMRRDDPEFARATRVFDHFVPDSQVLTAAMHLLKTGRTPARASRVYGPTFFRHCVLNAPRPLTHFFLGGSEDCLEKLSDNLLQANRDIIIAGSHHGYFERDEESDLIDEINRLSPDFIWVGLGTPLQQQWIGRHAAAIERGVICAVGFAFDVNAGTKRDAPRWMQRSGLGWLFRLLAEPRRLWKRYLHWNSRFLWMFTRQWLAAHSEPRRHA